MINEEIRDKEVRLIDDAGEQLGIVDIDKAQNLALEKNLDLVKIAPQAKPPVCKIMDYGKYRFEALKKEKEARKNQKIVSVKEIRLSPRIDEHDFMTKLNRAKKFIASGDKVKVALRFRGREMTHIDLGRKTLERFAQDFEEIATIEKKSKMEGRNLIMFISPK